MCKGFVCFLIVVIFCSEVVAGELKQVSFIPQWTPQAQFAGYYMAYEKGFYRKHGLDVKILTGGPEALSSDYLKDGKVDFATIWLATAIQMRTSGIKVVNIGQIVQRSALMLIAKRSKVKNLKDLNGKMVGVWNECFQIPLKAFFRKYHLKVKLVRMSSINLFLQGGVNVTSAMWYNEYDTILMSGVEPKELATFFFYKYDLNYPEDGIYTTETTLREKPAVCRNFVKSSVEGWLYAFSHPKETIDVVLRYMLRAHVPANRTHQRWMLARMKDIILPYGNHTRVGRLSSKDYYGVVGILRDQDLIESIPPFRSFCRETCCEK